MNIFFIFNYYLLITQKNNDDIIILYFSILYIFVLIFSQFNRFNNLIVMTLFKKKCLRFVNKIF